MQCSVLRSISIRNILKFSLKTFIPLSLVYSSLSFALPDVNQVVSGEANIAADATKALQINQNTDKAIINWNSFNIAADEKVHFQQPVNGICLNRIDATNGMSQVNGNLSSTATIYLINQSGILFGKDAKVNVGGILASGIELADDSFANDKLSFAQTSDNPGAVINRGVINVSEKGIAYFLGASVSNEGIIQAKLSKMVLASGDKFSIDFFDNDVLSFDIDIPTAKSGVDENGLSLSTAVSISGKCIDDAGYVFITAKAAQGVFDNLINMSGVVRAKTIKKGRGLVVLLGHEGTVEVTGELDLSGETRIDKAGHVNILGEHIKIDNNAKINSSAGASGGIIWIGSQNKYNWIKVPYTNSKSVYVGPNVTLNADTTTSGNGGNIYVTSDYELTFQGTASARSGVLGLGNGGNVIIRSEYDFVRPFFDSTRNIDVSSSNGSRGVVSMTSVYDKYLGMPIFRFIQWGFYKFF